MKKVLSLILTVALLASLMIASVVPVSAIDVTMPDVVVGSGIPDMGNLSYKSGNYEMNVLISSPSTTTIRRNAGVLDINDLNYRHNITSQIKYPADAGSGKITYSFVASFRGVANGMSFKVYDKSMNLYGTYGLCWGTPTQFKATGNEAYNTTNSKNYTFKLEVNLATGTFGGYVNGNTFENIGNHSKTLPDFATRGIGMVEYVVNTGYTTSNTGVVLRGASVSDENGNAIASGLPVANVHEYTNGDYALKINCEYDYYSKPLLTNSNVQIISIEKDRKIIPRIYYAADSSDGTLRYEFDVTYVGSPGWRTAFNVYDKNNKSIGTYQVVNTSSPNRYQHSSYPYVSTSGSDKLSYTVNLATGEFTFAVATPSASCVLKTGTVDVSNGVGLVEYAYESSNSATNTGITLNGASVTQLAKTVVSDHFALIDGIPSDFGTYNGVKLSKTVQGTASANFKNGKIVLENATDGSSNYARINFEKVISSADNGRTAFIEVNVTPSEQLVGTTGLRFNAKDPNGGWPITGANLVSSSKPCEANTDYTFGIWLDFSSANRFVVYKNGEYFTEGKLSTTAGIANIYFEYFNPNGAPLTINDISYTIIEPSNYDAQTNQYYANDVMLVNGIPHYNKATTWTQNGIKFEATKTGNATMTRLPLCDGIKFTNSSTKNDYVRLSFYPNASETTFPEGIMYARWDFTLEGTDAQKVVLASRGDGNWGLLHDVKLNPGTHTIEFVYNPDNNMYKCIFDGSDKVLRQHTLTSVADILIEWYGNDAADVLTMTNARLMNIKDYDKDSFGAIEISDDKKSANANVHIAEKFNFIDGYVTFVIVAYDGNKLTAVNVQEIAISRGDNPISIALEDLNGGKEVKAFIIDSISNPAPLSTPAVK